MVDFDPFNSLDMNFDAQVDATDLKAYEFANHGTYGLDDIDHDQVMDKFDNDLNNDHFIDDFQQDLNHNNFIDQFEQNTGVTEFNADVNSDGTTDAMDRALAQSIYGL